jgi:uncharacterized protein YoxC
MPLAAVVTLIGTALTIVVLAAYLIRVALILKHVSFTLGTIVAGVRAIANQTEPLGQVVNDINQELDGLRAALEALVEAKSKSKVQA